MEMTLRSPLVAHGWPTMIVCDVDGVLLDFSKGLSKYAKSRYGMSLDPCPKTWGFGLPKADADSLCDEFVHSSDFGKLDPFPGVDVADFNRNIELGGLRIISAAPAYRIDARMENMERLGFKIPADLLVHWPDKKTRIISEVKPKVCIEDSPNNIAAFMDAGIIVLAPGRCGYVPKEDSLGGPTARYGTIGAAIKAGRRFSRK